MRKVPICGKYHLGFVPDERTNFGAGVEQLRAIIQKKMRKKLKRNQRKREKRREKTEIGEKGSLCMKATVRRPAWLVLLACSD